MTKQLIIMAPSQGGSKHLLMQPRSAMRTLRITRSHRVETLAFVVAVVLCWSSVFAWTQQPPGNEVGEQFARAKRLIDANCGECSGASRTGLEQGISELLKAIANGAGNMDAAYELLEEAYNTLETLYTVPRSPEHDELAQRRIQIYRDLVVRHPIDPDLLLKYAKVTEDAGETSEEISALDRLLKVDPTKNEARFALSLALVKNRDIRRAMIEATAAVKAANQEQIEMYGETIVKTLTRSGHAQQP